MESAFLFLSRGRKRRKNGSSLKFTLYLQKIKCPKCNSKNISVLKGDGFSIVGADYIAIICNDCKKVYGFNDVKYKPNCSKEL